MGIFSFFNRKKSKIKNVEALREGNVLFRAAENELYTGHLIPRDALRGIFTDEYHNNVDAVMGVHEKLMEYSNQDDFFKGFSKLYGTSNERSLICYLLATAWTLRTRNVAFTKTQDQNSWNDLESYLCGAVFSVIAAGLDSIDVYSKNSVRNFFLNIANTDVNSVFGMMKYNVFNIKSESEK